MTVNLSIKNAPDAIVERLRRRAARNHRSLQGELMAIIEAAAMDHPPTMTVRQVAAEARRLLGGSQPSESAAMIREDRDHGH